MLVVSPDNLFKVPVPEDQPFPRKNDVQQMKKMLHKMKFVFQSVEVAAVALAIISVGAASSVYSKFIP